MNKIKTYNNFLNEYVDVDIYIKNITTFLKTFESKYIKLTPLIIHKKYYDTDLINITLKDVSSDSIILFIYTNRYKYRIL